MNNNKFLTLLMGECEHEYEWNPTFLWRDKVYLCTLCGERSEKVYLPDHLSNPLPVIRWMEKEMPEVWEDYVDSQFVLFRYDKKEAYECLNKVLDLSNLVAYLSEHREWGEKECIDCGGNGTVFEYVEGVAVGKWDCLTCSGAGIFKHPALVYLEASCEIK
jgi:hypothetical protein